MSRDLRLVLRHVLSISVLAPLAAASAAACSGATTGDVADAGDSGTNGNDGGGNTTCAAPNTPMWNQPGCGRPADRCITPDTPLPACYGVVCGCSGKVVSGCGAFPEAYVALPQGKEMPAEGSACDPGPPKDAGPDGAITNCVTTPQPIPDDAGAGCAPWLVAAPCDYPVDGGVNDNTYCQKWCGSNATFCSKIDDKTLRCDPGCAIGRRPEGFTAGASTREACASEITGAYFAAMSELEAASVFSFERLAMELAAHGAPHALVVRALVAADEERRHARVAGALARTFGSDGIAPNPTAMSIRSLEEIALENAVEGCVRETFGALTATLQSERAEHDRVRKAMARIAVDETSHAELAWDVAAWIESQLDEGARARLRAAQAHAVAELAAEVTMEQPAQLVALAGLPRAAEASRMLASLCDALELPRALAA